MSNATLLPLVGPGGHECPRCGTMTYRYEKTLADGRVVHVWPGGENGWCAECWGRSVNARENARREKAQVGAGIPPKYRGIAKGEVVKQPAGEPVEKFVARVKEGRDSDARCWGVSAADRTPFVELWKWRPEHGSVYLEGAPGTGKSMAAAMLANDLVSRPMSYNCVCRACMNRWLAEDLTEAEVGARKPEDWQGWDQERHVRIRPAVLRIDGPVGVRWLTESALVEDMGKKWEDGQDPKQGIVDMAKAAEVLVIDDLGSNASMTEKQKDGLCRLLDYRYTGGKRQKPVIFTSNLPLGSATMDTPEKAPLRLKFGERFVSRVMEMVGPRRFELTTQWRNPK